MFAKKKKRTGTTAPISIDSNSSFDGDNDSGYGMGGSEDMTGSRIMVGSLDQSMMANYFEQNATTPKGAGFGDSSRHIEVRDAPSVGNGNSANGENSERILVNKAEWNRHTQDLTNCLQQLQTMGMELMQHEESIRNLTTERDALKSQVARNTNSSSGANPTAEYQIQRITELELQLAQEQSANAQLKQRLHTATQVGGANNSNNNTQHMSLMIERLNKLQTANDDLQKQLAAQTTLSSAGNDMATLRKKVANYEAQIGVLHKQSEQLSTQLKDTQQTVAQWKEKATQAESEVSALTRERNSLKATLEAKDKTISTLKSSHEPTTPTKTNPTQNPPSLLSTLLSSSTSPQTQTQSQSPSTETTPLTNSSPGGATAPHEQQQQHNAMFIRRRSVASFPAKENSAVLDSNALLGELEDTREKLSQAERMNTKLVTDLRAQLSKYKQQCDDLQTKLNERNEELRLATSLNESTLRRHHQHLQQHPGSFIGSPTSSFAHDGVTSPGGFGSLVGSPTVLSPTVLSPPSSPPSSTRPLGRGQQPQDHTASQHHQGPPVRPSSLQVFDLLQSQLDGLKELIDEEAAQMGTTTAGVLKHPEASKSPSAENNRRAVGNSNLQTSNATGDDDEVDTHNQSEHRNHNHHRQHRNDGGHHHHDTFSDDNDDSHTHHTHGSSNNNDPRDRSASWSSGGGAGTFPPISVEELALMVQERDSEIDELCDALAQAQELIRNLTGTTEEVSAKRHTKPLATMDPHAHKAIASEHSDMKQEIATLNEKLLAAETAHANTAKEVANLNAALDEKASEIALLKEQISTTEDNHKQLQEVHANTSQAHNAAVQERTELDTRLKDTQTQLDQHRSHITELQNKLKAVEEQHAVAIKEVNDLKATNSTLQNQAAQLGEELASANNRHNELQEVHANTSSAHTTAVQQSESLSAKLKALETTIAQQTNEIGILTEQLGTSQTNHQEATREVSDLTGLIDQQAAEIALLKEQISTTEDNHKQLQEAHANVKVGTSQEINSLHAKLKSATEETVLHATHKSELEEKLRVVEASNLELQRQLQDKLALVDSQTAEINNLQQAIADAQLAEAEQVRSANVPQFVGEDGKLVVVEHTSSADTCWHSRVSAEVAEALREELSRARHQVAQLQDQITDNTLAEESSTIETASNHSTPKPSTSTSPRLAPQSQPTEFSSKRAPSATVLHVESQIAEINELQRQVEMLLAGESGDVDEHGFDDHAVATNHIPRTASFSEAENARLLKQERSSRRAISVGHHSDNPADLDPYDGFDDQNVAYAPDEMVYLDPAQVQDLEHQFAVSEAEKEELRKQLDGVKAEIISLRENRKLTEQECNELRAKCQHLEDKIIIAERVRVSLMEEVERQDLQTGSKELETVHLREKVVELQFRLEQLHVQDMVQTSHDTMERRARELLKRKRLLRDQAMASEEGQQEAVAQLSKFEDRVATLEAQLLPMVEELQQSIAVERKWFAGVVKKKNEEIRSLLSSVDHMREMVEHLGGIM